MQREGQQRLLARAGEGRRDGVPLHRLDLLHQSELVQRRLSGGQRVHAVGVHHRRHLDHRVGGQPGQGGAVADIQDHRGPLVPGDGRHHAEGDTGIALVGRVGLPLAVGGRGPLYAALRLGHIAGAAGVHRLPPQLGRTLARRLRGVEELGLGPGQEVAAGPAGGVDLPHRVAVEVVVVQVLVGDDAESVDPVGAEDLGLLHLTRAASRRPATGAARPGRRTSPDASSPDG